MKCPKTLSGKHYFYSWRWVYTDNTQNHKRYFIAKECDLCEIVDDGTLKEVDYEDIPS